MSEHTPGPWELRADRAHFDTLTTIEAGERTDGFPGRRMIVQVGGGCQWQEAEANARLIAAAPELYEALAALVTAAPATGTAAQLDALSLARAALSKARPAKESDKP